MCKPLPKSCLPFRRLGAALVVLTLACVTYVPLAQADEALAPKADGGHVVRVNRVVAVIDRDIITEYELLQKAEGHLESLVEMAAGAEREAAKKTLLRQVLDAEIGERLLNREVAANKDKLGVGEKDIDRAVEEVLSINRIGRDQLQAALYKQGLTMAEYRAKLRSQIERARLVQFKVQGRVNVKDGEVRRHCLQRQRLGSQNMAVCAGHVLLNLPDKVSPQRKKALVHEAEKIRDQLRQGASLAALAQKYSDDTSTSDGNLGCFHRGEMVQAFEDAAFALGKGEVSEVVESNFGLHVIKVFERRLEGAGGCATPEELEPSRNELYQQEMARQMEVWLGELRHATFVETRL